MKNKKKINYKVLIIIIAVAALITAVLAFLFIKNKNVIIKQGEKKGELLQSYTGSISATLFGSSTSISYEANQYLNSAEDSNYPYWQYYSFKIGKKKFNYTWLGGKCYLSSNQSNYGYYCKSLTYNNFGFFSFESNGSRYVAVVSSPVKVEYTSKVETPPYTATVFLETDSEYQMVFEVPTPRYVQFNLSTSNFGSYSSNYNFLVNTSSGYLQYLAMSTTPGKVDVHKVYFNGSNVSDNVVGQESGSIKMS